MHRCFAPPENWSDDAVELDAREAHHLVHVLRLAPGESVEVFDGTGRRAPARIVSVPGRSGIGLRLVGPPEMSDPIVPDLLLVQAIPKAERMDWIIEKSVELGVAAIQPVVTERVIIRGDERGWERKRERWFRIAKEAARQCGACRIPEIRAPAAYDLALGEGARRDLFVVGALGVGLMPLGAVADDAASRGMKSVALLIGPEGDFTSEELRLATEAGAVPVTFGRQVLRVETAAVYGVSVLMSAWLTRGRAEVGAGPAQGKSGPDPSPAPVSE